MSLSLQEAAAYLHAHAGEIYDAWEKPSTHKAGILFKRLPFNDFCPTITKLALLRRPPVTAIEKLVDEAMIPCSGRDIKPQHLAEFVRLWERIALL